MTRVTVKLSDNTEESHDCDFCKAKDGFLELHLLSGPADESVTVLYYPESRIRHVRSVSPKKPITMTPTTGMSSTTA